MDEIQNADLAELAIMSRASIDFQFSMWVTITFALMAAAFATRENLRTGYKLLIVFLYLAAILTLVSRGVSDAQETAKLIRELVERNVPFSIPTFTIVMRVTVVILGTIGALIFVIVPHAGLVRKD